jgi:hypothetical protein
MHASERRVDNSRNLVDNSRNLVDNMKSDRDRLRPLTPADADSRDSTAYVGSEEARHPSPGADAEPTDAERSAFPPSWALRDYPPIGNVTSERELIEGRGICGRCGGTGVVALGLVGDPLHTRDCPRCDGTGRKLP